MFANPFYGGKKPGENENESSNSSDHKEMLDDMTDQSIDTSNIEETNPPQRGFSNPFHEKAEAVIDFP